MKLKITICIYFVFCISLVFGQTGENVTPVFWKIGNEKPVYLLGTIHMGVDAGKTFPGKVWECLEECDTLVLEIDLTKVNQFAMLSKMQLPVDKSLDKLLGPEHWKKLEEFTKPYPAVMLKRFKPFVIESIAAEKFLPMAPAVELTLIQKAKKQQIKIEQLETVDQQLDAISSVPEEATIEGIKNMLDDIPAAKEQAEQMLKAYKSGDLEKIEEITLLSEAMQKWPEFAEKVIFERNRNWIPKIKDYIEQGNVFIGVGAGHFVGEEGVISLLEKEGYEVNRIVFEE